MEPRDGATGQGARAREEITPPDMQLPREARHVQILRRHIPLNTSLNLPFISLLTLSLLLCHIRLAI